MPVEDGEWDENESTPPADPANLGTNSSGPEVETPLLPHGRIEDSLTDEEPHPETQIEMSESEGHTKAEAIPEFDQKVREDFEGLLYLGRLTDQFVWLGHTFTIRTLTAGEILEVGLLHRKYVGTLADVKAYQAAVVAACVMDVDDRPMPVPITNEITDTAMLNRFRYVLRSWFPPTLDAIYERYLLLERRVEEVIKTMGEAPGWTESTRSSNDTSV